MALRHRTAPSAVSAEGEIGVSLAWFHVVFSSFFLDLPYRFLPGFDESHFDWLIGPAFGLVNCVIALILNVFL